MEKDIFTIERELLEWAKKNGHVDANGNFTEKGRLTFRQSFLDKTQAENYFANLGKANATFASQMQTVVKEMERITSEENDEALKMIVGMFRDCAGTDNSMFGMIVNVLRVVDALAMNNVDLLKDFKELVSAFNKSDQEGKGQLVKLQAKLDQQDKAIAEAKQFVRYFHDMKPTTTTS